MAGGNDAGAAVGDDGILLLVFPRRELHRAHANRDFVWESKRSLELSTGALQDWPLAFTVENQPRFAPQYYPRLFKVREVE